MISREIMEPSYNKILGLEGSLSNALKTVRDKFLDEQKSTVGQCKHVG